jgi:hypothetical protein
MADIEYIEDSVQRAFGRLPGQFKGKVKLQKFLTGLVEPFQDLEDSLHRLQTEMNLYTAVGAQLDQLGELVGQPREGRNDADYRLWIQAKTVVNRSTSTIDDNLKVLSLITPNSTYDLHEFPQAYLVYVYGLEVSASAVYAILSLIKAAGIGFGLVYSVLPQETTFSYAPGDTEVTNTSLGYGDATDPSVGGYYMGAY